MVELARRDVFRLGAAALVTGAAAGATAGTAFAAKPGGGGGGGGTVSRNALRIAPVLEASTTITAQPARVQIGAAERMSNVLAYAGSVPGPTFVVPRGGRIDVTVNNGLTVPTMTHWHGLVVPTAHDGQPQDPIVPGASRTYVLDLARANQPGALNFYHPHPHLQTGSQVYMGLAGGFLVRDPREEELGLPCGTAQEVPLVIRDASFDSAGNLSYGGKASGFLGSTPMVNGTLDPFLGVAKGTYRFRIVNAATARIFRLVLSNGAPFTLIGNDGGLLPAAVTLTSIDMCPGERVDVLVDTRTWTAPVLLRCASAGWTLLELRPTGVAGDVTAAPAALSTVETLVQTGASRRFSFDGMTRINGKVFDHHRIDFTAVSGTVERWTFVTNGNAPHPVHVHGASYQIQSRRGGRGKVLPWEAGWKDTLLLNDREEVDVLIRFDEWQRGEKYLIHCHKLEHEDAGMMSAFAVA